MCIICIKNKGLDLPSKKIIQTMCNNNHHGNGFCYAENGQVIIQKGYMDFESYYEALKQIPNIKDKNVVLHCRITTHGSTSGGNCHPFPLSNSIKELKAHEIKANVGIIHNGIIRSVQADRENDLSDTMTYIKDKLYKRYTEDNSFMDKIEAREDIEKEIGSKMVIMKSDGEYYIIGEFNTDSNGHIYSNHSYVPYDYYDYLDSSSNSDFDIFEDDYILLEYTDFILMQGERIHGDEVDLYMAKSGEVYMEDSESLSGFIKVSDCAFDEEGFVIDYRDRLLEEMGWNEYDFKEVF